MSTKIKYKSDIGGLLGEKLKVNKVNGNVVVTNRPKRKMVGDPSEKQAAAQRRFLVATQYAKYQNSVPELRELYATGITDNKRTAFAVAVSDFLNAPEIESINASKYRGAIGDPIIVSAFDDFKVVGVRVMITDAGGSMLEEGDAAQDKAKPSLWIYQCTVANAALAGTTINAIAVDTAGNETSLDNVL